MIAAALALPAGAGGACCAAVPLPAGAQEVAAGAWLGRAALATLMMPEAYEEGGSSAGLATIAGFLCTFFFAVLALR